MSAPDIAVDELKALREYFEGKSGPEMATDIQLKPTLGQGHFGRVRLVESTTARSHLQSLDTIHSGLFALKIMKKSEILRLKQKDHVKSERHLLLKLKNPFIVSVYHTYQDERNVYMLMEYIPGGELGHKLRIAEKFNNELARFYVAQVVMVLQYLHGEHIIYRGVGTTDLLLDANGYIKIVDFGFAKYLPPKEDEENKTYTLCGQPEYLAPETIKGEGHGKGADWWALGILIHELLGGYPPFFDLDAYNIYKQILTGLDNKSGRKFDPLAWELIKKLLVVDASKRMGCANAGAEEIKRSKWFRGLDWAALYNKTMKAPEVPEIKSEDDTSNFDTYPDSIEESGPLLTPDIQKTFEYFANSSAANASKF